ncbi:MAG TPA: hypothetical protein DEG17_05895 [Cyanobacteria bacterium UBA11149]|nr:hypothetical protein [Cyanobacteria bacterium UBA11367]HBE58368.1 hypothetical protein [Cyanobacteria bacterium UBA11366]HBK62849.1 hypothetical protein [Cyanobacteria bacterium UBA11166]HBR73180.1 hypothetical protein [Cyanobacteria bacterium UBA11159]HBS72249.1 hypothetical protein [Cyanobacteria bacterium UBA11153]HBW88410.1 hypothetical protein [Cyanobacteria bacterium UBA11149]HCA95349.1 hypothetical protein [Cyanobacteria bacterium UBA9226]
MTEFLRYLKIEAQPKNWYIEPFCSAYYSNNSLECYQDRHPMAWRVKILFAEPCSEDTEIRLCHFEPIGVENADDDTWDEDEDSGNWSSMKYIAIADFNPWDWEKFLESSPEEDSRFIQPRTIESTYLDHYVIHARFDLGVIHFPDEEERVREFIRYIEKYNASTNWAKTMHGW